MTITGLLMPAAATPAPTTSAVRSAIGRIDALSAAVTARSSRPYSPVSSADVVTGRPSSDAAAPIADSLVRSSGAKASATAIASAPAACRRTTTSRAVAGAEAARDVEELRHRVERPALAELDAGTDRPLARLAQVGRPAHADHADAGDVPFEQRVDGLGGRVRDEVDALRADFDRELRDDVDDAGRDAVRVVVRRRHDRVGDDGAAFHVEGDGFRERPADVDPDANRHRLSAASRPTRPNPRRPAHRPRLRRRRRRACGVERRNCGRSTNMYNAPSAYTVMSASCAVIVSRLGQ